MSKWTQEQRTKAIRDTEEMMMDSDRATAVESYNDAAIELACQRNELLEALKNLASLAKDSIPDAEDWHDYHHALLAIAKAEGK